MDNHSNNQEEEICNAMRELGSISDNDGDVNLLQNSNDNSLPLSVELMAISSNDNDNNDNDDNDDNSRVDIDKIRYENRPLIFDKEVFDSLKSNDPEANIVNFEAEEDMEFLSTIDWEGDDGNVFANNTGLKQLHIFINRELGEKEKILVNNLLLSIEDNKSIQQLSIDGNEGLHLDMAETISIISSFIQNNTNLCRLILTGFILDSTNVKMLASALSNNKSLFAFGLNYCKGLTADILTQVVDAVEASGIQRLILSYYDMDNKVAVTLGRLLCISNTLKGLEINGVNYGEDEGGHVGSITAEGMKFISEYLKLENSSLIHLDLRDTYIGEDGALHLADGLINNSTLKSLYLKNCDLRPLGGLVLVEALQGNSTLEYLDLYYAISPGRGDIVLKDSGWDIIFTSLKHSALRSLELGCNDMKDSQISSLVDSINTMPSLEKLGLANVNVTSSGWMSFFTLLQQPSSVLERLITLDIVGNNISDEVMICIANALASNASLKALSFREEGLTDISWSSLERLFCNKSSIDTIYDSNHTLAYSYGVGRESIKWTNSVLRLLKLNQGADKTDIARQKIIQYHFLGGNGSNMHEIMKLDLEMMPHVIGFFGRYDMITIVEYHTADEPVPPVEKVAGLELIYRLTKGMPSLFD